MINIVGAVFLVGWFSLYGYALDHRTEPFWYGFLHPFG